MASATAMYHSERDPLHRINYKTEKVSIPKGIKQRRLHKAFLRYHDPDNWPLLREALKAMGKAHLIGYGKKHLVPPNQPVKGTKQGAKMSQNRKAAQRPGNKNKQGNRKNQKGKILTQHTGLPPRKSK
ncbi:hypothetical protein A3766_23020 [Oleiphilus sp. HI0132]|nr:hypothetical protein A3766_23020 [Oleiphilus sp. HI0132]